MIIGLVGFIGSGKGTVGELLVEEGFVSDSFAKPLKDACSAIFGWPRDYLEGDTPSSRNWREQPDSFWSEKFGYEFTPRLALQLMGTEAGRNVFHKDVWVISLLNRSHGKNIVVTDVRFQNEISYIQKHGGYVVRVKRGDEPDWYNIAEEANAGFLKAKNTMRDLGIHQSEWDWIGSKFDAEIHNNGTLDDLGKSVESLLRNLRK